MRAIFTIFSAWLVICQGPLCAEEKPAAGGLTRVPVQVVSHNGGESKWLMVDVAAESIPEPEALVLAMMSGLLLMRRRRN